MTRPPEEVALVRSLASSFNQTEIARLTGIPRGTVKGWLNGYAPQFYRSGAMCDGACDSRVQLPEKAYAYLLGVYLGDGCISAMPRNVYKLRIACDSLYVGILAECKAAIAAVMPYNVIGQVKTKDRRNGEIKDSRGVEVVCHSKHWPCLFPQHGPGRKHLRKIELVPWQQKIVARHPKQLVRGLIHTDGCRSLNRVKGRDRYYEYPRYQFCNESQDIKGIFCDALDQLGIAWRVMNRKTISVARREAVAAMDGFVGPKT